MPVLVTGATGFLGSHLVDVLLEQGERVRALVRLDEDATALTRREVEIVRGDLKDAASLPPAVREVDRVFHCGARAEPWGPRKDYFLTNVQSLGLLVDAALAAGVQRFVHVSSITVHGNDVGGTVDETAPIRVESNPYSWSKVMGERLLQRIIQRENAPVTIVRPGWIYGPRSVASFARFAAMIERGKMVLIGSGRNHIPLIYARDVARGMLLASEKPQAIGRTYLLVNDEPVTQLDYLSAIAAELGAAPPSRHVPYHLALLLGAVGESTGHLLRLRNPPPLMRYGVQLLGGENRFVIERARSELGFTPETSMVEGVRKSVRWYRGDPAFSQQSTGSVR